VFEVFSREYMFQFGYEIIKARKD